MALQKQFTTVHGFDAPEAYARITNFNGTKESIMVNVEVHKDADARLAAMQPIEVFNISLPLAEGATMQEMYDALKLDSNFEGAIDC